MSLDKGDYPENSQVTFFPNSVLSFEPLVCLDLVLERWQSFLFQFFFFFFFLIAPDARFLSRTMIQQHVCQQNDRGGEGVKLRDLFRSLSPKAKSMKNTPETVAKPKLEICIQDVT